jgi:hypothetical protein
MFLLLHDGDEKDERVTQTIYQFFFVSAINKEKEKKKEKRKKR